MTSPVVLFVCTQSSPVMCTAVLVGAGANIFIGGGIVATWLDMILYPFRRLALVLYLCTSGTLNVIPSYGCFFGDITSVSSGMKWASIWGGLIFTRPEVIAIFVFMFNL